MKCFIIATVYHRKGYAGRHMTTMGTSTAAERQVATPPPPRINDDDTFWLQQRSVLGNGDHVS